MDRIRLSDRIARVLEEMIADGRLNAGERLPGERELAARLRVSRPSLREAIRKLNSKGLLATRRGGGTYVRATPDPRLNDSLMSLLHDHPEARFDVLEVRHALEGTAAYYAALRGTSKEKAQIRQRYEEMIARQGSSDPINEARADAAFHLSIVEASHNRVLLEIMRGLFDLLRSSISQNLGKLYTLPRVSEPLSRQHYRLMNAIIEGDAEKARTAAREHLTFVEESLQRIERHALREPRTPPGRPDSGNISHPG